jgi:hypothetical protein
MYRLLFLAWGVSAVPPHVCCRAWICVEGQEDQSARQAQQTLLMALRFSKRLCL